MRFIKFYLLIFALINTSYAAKITDPVLTVGKDAATDFTMIHKDGGYIKKVGSQGDWFFSTDGVLEKKIGSGSGAGGAGGINLLPNNSFEDGLTDWVTSGGTLTQETYVNGIESDLKYARFVSTVAGQYVESACVTKPDNFDVGGMADVKYLGGSGNFELKIFDCVASDIEKSSAVLADITSWLKSPIQTFTTPAQVKLRIISTAAGTIDFDDAYTGSNKNVADVNAIESQMSGFTYLGKASSNDIRFTPGITGLLDVAGSIFTYVDDGTDGTRITFTKAADVTLSIRLGQSSTQGYFIRVNGNNISAETSQQSGSVDSGATAVRILANIGDVLTVQGSSSTFNQGQMIITAKTREVKLSTYTPEQSEFYLESTISGLNVSINASTTVFTEAHNSGLTMVNHQGSAKIPCFGTNPSTGTTCSASNESVGIAFNNTISGLHEVCAEFTHNNQTDPTYFKLSRVQNASVTIIEDSKLQIYTNLSSGQGGQFVRLCGNYALDTIGENTFKLFYTHPAGTNGTLWTADGGTNTNMRMTVRAITENKARPVINNMVSTLEKDGLNIGRCVVNTNTFATAVNGSPAAACDTWIDSFAANGTHKLVVNIKAGFSKNSPVCTCTSLDGGTGSDYCGGENYPGWSSTRADFASRTSSAINARDIMIICTGDR